MDQFPTLAVKRSVDASEARIDELSFAIQWNKLDYAQMHLLNHSTIIEWTVRYSTSNGSITRATCISEQ